MFEIKLPELGEGISSVEISDVLVNTGDTLKIDDPMIVVETEKASMEIPATSSGIVNKIHVNKGGTISPGDIIISISGDTVKTPESEKITEDEKTTIEKQDSETIDTTIIKKTDTLMQTEPPSTTSPLGKPVLASPSVRRFARELGCDLNKVNGSGSKGRITQDDVQNILRLV